MPISNDPNEVSSGAATTARGANLGRRAPCGWSRVGHVPPPGKGSECRGTKAWVRHPVTPTGGVYGDSTLWWVRHPVTLTGGVYGDSTLWEGASESRRRASGDARSCERGPPQNSWRAFSVSNKYSLLNAWRCLCRVSIEFCSCALSGISCARHTTLARSSSRTTVHPSTPLGEANLAKLC